MCGWFHSNKFTSWAIKHTPTNNKGHWPGMNKQIRFRIYFCYLNGLAAQKIGTFSCIDFLLFGLFGKKKCSILIECYECFSGDKIYALAPKFRWRMQNNENIPFSDHGQNNWNKISCSKITLTMEINAKQENRKMKLSLEWKANQVDSAIPIHPSFYGLCWQHHQVFSTGFCLEYSIGPNCI